MTSALYRFRCYIAGVAIAVVVISVTSLYHHCYIAVVFISPSSLYHRHYISQSSLYIVVVVSMLLFRHCYITVVGISSSSYRHTIVRCGCRRCPLSVSRRRCHAVTSSRCRRHAGDDRPGRVGLQGHDHQPPGAQARLAGVPARLRLLVDAVSPAERRRRGARHMARRQPLDAPRRRRGTRPPSPPPPLLPPHPLTPSSGRRCATGRAMTTRRPTRGSSSTTRRTTTTSRYAPPFTPAPSPPLHTPSLRLPVDALPPAELVARPLHPTNSSTACAYP